MKNSLTALALATILLLLPGCEAAPQSGQSAAGAESGGEAAQADSEIVAVTDLAADAEQTAGKLANGAYPNLRGNVTPRVSFTGNLSAQRQTYHDMGVTFSEFAQEALDFFSAYQPCDASNVIVTTFDGDGTSHTTNWETIQQEGSAESYQEVNAFLYRNGVPGAEMQFTRTGVALWTNRGAIAALSDEIFPQPGYPDYGGEVYDLRAGADPDTVFSLQDGEITLREAMEVFDREINRNYFLDGANEAYLYEVHGAVPCAVTEDETALKLLARPVYQGIPFDAFYGEWNASAEVPGFDFQDGGVLSNAMMLTTDTLDSTIGIGRTCTMEPAGDPLTEVVPLSRAVQTLSDLLTTGTTFEVDCIELLYVEDGEGEVLEDGSYTQVFRPTWKIRLLSDTNQARYDYYIDLETGSIAAREESNGW